MASLPDQHMLRSAPDADDFLARGYHALLAEDYENAIRYYLKAILQHPELRQCFEANIKISQNKYRIARKQQDKIRVGVCGYSLSDNSAGRVFTLANIYGKFAEVEIIGSIFPVNGSQLWTPLEKTDIPKHYFLVENQRNFIKDAVDFVLLHPYDIVHLSKPRAPNIFMGIIYKLLWNATIFVDIDDEESAFFNHDRGVTFEEYLLEHASFPPMKYLTDHLWTRIGTELYNIFDAITVCNSAFAAKYGGIVIPHARDTNLFNTNPDYRIQNRNKYGIPPQKKIVLFFGTPRQHKGLEEVAKAISALNSNDIIFLIVGSFSDTALKMRLESIRGCNMVFWPNQPVANTSEILSLADCCVFFQDDKTMVGKIQTPAKLSDAICANVPIIANATLGNQDFIKRNCVVIADSENMSRIIHSVLFDGAYSCYSNSLAKEYISLDRNAGILQLLIANIDRNDIKQKNEVRFHNLMKLLQKKAPYSPLKYLPRFERSNLYGKYSRFVGKILLSEDVVVEDLELYFQVVDYVAKRAKRKARVAVFSAIAGGYDPLICPEVINDEWDYILFCDEYVPRQCGPFIIRKLNCAFDDATRFARYVKTHPHSLLPDYDYTIWIDSNIVLRGNGFVKEINSYINSKILLVGRKHPLRSSLREEVEACKQFNKDNNKILNAQVAKYYKEGFQDNMGMMETGILYRDNKATSVMQLNKLWWNEITSYSRRDQISIMYVLWKIGVEFRFFQDTLDIRERRLDFPCLFPHGGTSNRSLHAYKQPFFMAHDIRPKKEIRKNEIALLNMTRNYWRQKRKPRGTVVVYTAIIGNYDYLKAPLYINKDWDYICFTDRCNITGEHPWQIRHIDYIDYDNTRTARFIKTHPHLYLKEYEYSIWIDSHILIKDASINACAELFEKSGKILGAISHPHRGCTYSEGAVCIARGLDTATTVNEQLDYYKAKGFPCNYGLIESGVLFRRHNEKQSIRLNKTWWNLIDRFSHRDQLSIMFALWKLKLDYIPILPNGTSTRNSSAFGFHQHKAKQTGEKNIYTLPRYLAASYDQYCEPWWTDEAGPLPEDYTDQFRNISVDIIICVHNALEYVGACLESVDRSITSAKNRVNLIIVNDGSDTSTSQYLATYAAEKSHVRLLTQDKAAGYTKSANLGLRNSEADFVILLNSDTIVPRNWIAKLLHAAYSAAYIGIVGPLSNAASWQSVPLIKDPHTGKLAVNSMPEGMDVDDMDALVESVGCLSHFPLLALVNGFCYGIKREVIKSVGYLDETAFPLGYGEEDDYSLRVREAGFMLAAATHCYVYHAKSMSFGKSAREQLASQGRKQLDSRYGFGRVRYAAESAQKNPVLAFVRKRISLAIEAYNKKLGRSLTSTKNAPAAPGFSKMLSPSAPMIDEASISRMSQDELNANRNFISMAQPLWNGAPASVLIMLPQFTNVLAGGVRTVLMAADNFQRHWGCSVTFCLMKTGMGNDNVDRASLIKTIFPDLQFNIVMLDDYSHIDNIPYADIAICTAWTTAFLLAKYNRTRAKFYFIQDYETLFYPAGTIAGLIEETYNFGFFGICNSSGIGEIYSRYNTPYMYFTPAVDQKIYKYDPSISKTDPFQIVFYGRPKKPRNAFQIGIDALRIVKKYFGDKVRIVAAGDVSWKPAAYNVEGIIENLGLLNSLDAISELYQRSTLGLVFMLTPHPSYQPLEYMASGCITITNRNNGTKWLLRHEENCMLTSLFPADIAQTIIDVLRDENLRNKLIKGSIETVSSLSWDKAFSDIRSFIRSPLRYKSIADM